MKELKYVFRKKYSDSEQPKMTILQVLYVELMYNWINYFMVAITIK